MINYDNKTNEFNIPDAEWKKYIEQLLKHSPWNETQLCAIVSNIADFINATFTTFKHYPGDIVNFFNKLITINLQRKDQDKEFIKELIKLRRDPYPRPIKKFAVYITWIYQRCTDVTYNLDLHHTQKYRHYSDAQLAELHQIIDTFLKTAVNCVKQSLVYKNAEKQGSLCYKLDELLAYQGNIVDILPSKEQIAASKSNTLQGQSFSM